MLETNPKEHKLLTILVLCLTFSGIYILLIIGSAMLYSFLTELFHALALFRDSTAILSMGLYLTMVFLLFASLGMKFSSWTSNHLLKQVIIVLPVTLIGLLIWSMIFIKTQDTNAQFPDFSWLPYMIYSFWSMPVFDIIRNYFTNHDTLMYIGIIPSIFPGLSFLAGIWFRKQRLVMRTGMVSLLILVSIAISAVLPQTTKFTLDSYPKVDGATAAIPLGQILMQELTGASVKKSKDNVHFYKSHDAYVNLINRKADIIFVSGPSDDELKLAEEKNVQLKLTPIAKDAFIFLVHKKNPIDQLSVKQVQDIYSGKVTNWQQVGGDNVEIIAYQRNENSGSQTFMEKKIMKDIKLASAPMSRTISGMGGLIEEVAEFKNAKNSIGYSFYYFANEMHQNGNVKFLSIEGVPVNKETIISETYPFTATLYAVTREDEPADSAANQLLNWILSAEGSKAIEKGGFVPLR